MSKKYIEKEAALNILKELHAEAESPSAAEELFKAHERIGDINPADVKPVARGEWIEFEQRALGHTYLCSVCQTIHWGVSNFCPDCGADMRKEVNDEREH